MYHSAFFAIIPAMSETQNQSMHWADIMADRIIREKGEKDMYTCASGITPSGTVHIGNFREIITVELVVRALRERGKNVRFIYSWDDYDVFRKVPKNMPEPELLETYLRKPITLVPDTTGRAENYARGNEVAVEKDLPKVGVFPEYIYQAERYRSNVYAEEIRKALSMRDQIRAILNEFRTEPLAEDWWPVAVFSSFTNKDNTKVIAWDGEYGLTYRDLDLDKEETIDIRTTPNTKLPWRVDWPMRWAYEGVDFEPGGKDHLTEGGSYDTAKSVVKLFGAEAPVTMRYDFVRLKGKGGKISSSGGEVADLYDVLEIYPPEIVRYLFVGTRPSSEFAISFDLDVLKIYEDYDNTERIYFGLLPVNEKRREKEKRIYELSQVDDRKIPTEPGYQIPFRHLCNYLQIYGGDKEKVLERLEGITESQKERLLVRMDCAWAWISKYAPEEFCFSLQGEGDELYHADEKELAAIRDFAGYVDSYLDKLSEKEFSEYIYKAAKDNGMENADFFRLIYMVLINKEKGPKLAGFLKACGRDKTMEILRRY